MKSSKAKLSRDKLQSHKVVKRYVDRINLTADDWSSSRATTLEINGKRTFVRDNQARRNHAAKLLNLRVTRLAPECDVVEFYKQLVRFSTEIGFGDIEVIRSVTNRIYGITPEQ